jgi:hypothetical protein
MKKLSGNLRYFVAFVGIGILILMVISFNNRVTELRNLEAEAEAIGAQVAELQATNDLLETQIGYATSDAAVEAWAYEEAKMIREGDHPIVPLAPDDKTTSPEEIPPSHPNASLEKWRVWRALFFDSNLP